MKCNYFFAALLLLAGAATNASAQSEGVNLLTNGGFEGEVDMDGIPEGWTVGLHDYNYGTVSVLSEGAKEGKNCLQITGSIDMQMAADAKAKANEKWILNPDSYIANLGFWYKVPENTAYGAIEIYLDWDEKYEDGTSSHQSRVISEYKAPFDFSAMEKGDWSYYSYQGRTYSSEYPGPEAYYVKVSNAEYSVSLQAAGGKLLFDDVSFVISSTQGISSVETKLPVKADGTTLYVAARQGEQVRVFAADGTQVADVAAVNGTTKIGNLPQGLLLVKAGKKTAKVVIK